MATDSSRDCIYLSFYTTILNIYFKCDVYLILPFLLTGDPKESYYIGTLEDATSASLNQWPSEGMNFLCAHS
jgi:hypothetical protein